MDLKISKAASSIFLVLSILVLVFGVTVEASRSSYRKYSKKPAATLKTIKTEDGDIIDCVDIHKQPAFHNPALKNHKIQMRPSFYPAWIEEDDYSSNNATTTLQSWSKFRRCMEGTIPILRASKHGFHKSNFERNGKKTLNNTSYDSSKIQWKYNGIKENAAAYLVGEFYGAKADINVWMPSVEANTDEYSSSQIWIQSSSESIEFGVQVYPREYSDGRPRLFAFWTNDSYRDDMSCYNFHCQGFIQTSNRIVLGGAINPYSKPKGDSEYVTLGAYKDPFNGNWVLTFSKDVVGYWPANLFSSANGLSTLATSVQWGGEISNQYIGGVHTSTQMGSGQFPIVGYKLASYFRKLQIIDQDQVISHARKLKKRVTNRYCYNIFFHGVDDTWGSSFFYGGPGGFAVRCK